MSTGRIIKKQLYEQFARIGKALDSPQRLELLDLLCQTERSVEELAQEANLNFANASRHLQILRNTQLVSVRKEGVKVFYRLADNEICGFFQNMRKLAEKRLAEVRFIMDDYFGNRDKLEAIDRKELISRAKEGSVTILDVRPRMEYESGHLPNAKSIPLSELKSRLDELPRGQVIVAYCRGPYCVLAKEAVDYLKAKGYEAIRLEDGVWEWHDAGLPVDVKE